MASNPHVVFAFVTDMQMPLHLPPNVQVLTTSMAKLADLVHVKYKVDVKWRHLQNCQGNSCGTARTNKVSDLRPFMGSLFKELSEAHDFWGWVDADMLFGQLPKPPSSNVLCALWPNKVGLTTWGGLSAFRVNATLTAKHTNRTATGLEPFKLSKSWRRMLSLKRHMAFEELAFSCGGKNCENGMSNVLNPQHCQPSTWTAVREVCVKKCTDLLLVRPFEEQKVEVGLLHFLKGKKAIERLQRLQLLKGDKKFTVSVSTPFSN